MNGLVIRRATPDDAGAIRRFLVELAKVCRSEATITEEVIRSDFFSPLQRINAAVAEDERGVCGVTTWYYTYSTFRGKAGIYVEDEYINPDHRSLGLGKLFLDYLADLCVAEGYDSLNMIALKTNGRAAQLLESLRAERLDEFGLWKLDGDALRRAHLRYRDFASRLACAD